MSRRQSSRKDEKPKSKKSVDQATNSILCDTYAWPIHPESSWRQRLVSKKKKKKKNSIRCHIVNTHLRTKLRIVRKRFSLRWNFISDPISTKRANISLHVSEVGIVSRPVLGLVQFGSVPWPIGSSGGHEVWISRDPLPIVSAGDSCHQFWHGQGRPSFDSVHQAFPLPAFTSPTLQDALKDFFVFCFLTGVYF